MVNFTMLVRDRYTLTSQTLLWLAPQVVDEQMNITILDDRSQDDTKRLVHGWCLLNEAQLIRNETPTGTGIARNRVIRASELTYGRGRYLYLSDNDVVFNSDWLGKLCWAYDQVYPRFQVIGAYNHPFHQPTSRVLLSDGETYVHEVNALATQSMLMRWEVWDKYGPFCQTPVDKVCQSEDVDFTNKIRADGYKIGVVSPALVVSTGITNTFGEKIPGWELVKAQCPEGIVCE